MSSGSLSTSRGCFAGLSNNMTCQARANRNSAIKQLPLDMCAFVDCLSGNESLWSPSTSLFTWTLFDDATTKVTFAPFLANPHRQLGHCIEGRFHHRAQCSPVPCCLQLGSEAMLVEVSHGQRHRWVEVGCSARDSSARSFCLTFAISLLFIPEHPRTRRISLAKM